MTILKKRALIENYMNELQKAPDYLRKYDHILLSGDFNSGISQRAMHDIGNVYNLKKVYQRHLPALKT